MEKQIKYSCPYCRNLIEKNSKDHIFPDFLGGTRRINCCEKCNNLFGHTFEAAAAEILQPMQVFISSWGIPLKSSSPVWKNAFIKDQKSYDLTIDDLSVTYNLAKPIINKDENGEIISGEFAFRDRKQVDNLAKKLVDNGKAKKVEIEYVQGFEDMSQIHLSTLLHSDPIYNELL